MDRRARRLRRNRAHARRTKIGASIAVAAGALAVLATSTLGAAQESPDKPRPEVDNVDLTPEPVPVAAGWEGQVGTDANLVAVEWNGDQSADYTFEVRNGRGEWRQAAESGVFDNGPDPGSQDARAGGATPDAKHVTEPVWVGRDVTGVRVRLDDGSAQDVKLHVIDSTRGKKPEKNVESTGVNETEPAPPPSEPPPSAPPGGDTGTSPSSSTSTSTTTTTQPAQQGLGLGQGLAVAALASLVVAFVVRRRRLLAIVVVAVVALAACVPIKPPAGNSATVTRPQWGGDLDWNWGACPGGPEYADTVTTAIVHHTVNSNYYGPGDSVGMIRGIYAYHVYSLGYCDIAYNFLIDNYRTAFEGRWGGMDRPVIGAHSLGWNTRTTGIAMLGTFSGVAPSGGAEGTLIDLIRWKFKVHGVNPFDDPAADILGHRDTYQTECPGQALYNDLPGIRHWVKAGW